MQTSVMRLADVEGSKSEAVHHMDDNDLYNNSTLGPDTLPDFPVRHTNPGG